MSRSLRRGSSNDMCIVLCSDNGTCAEIQGNVGGCSKICAMVDLLAVIVPGDCFRQGHRRGRGYGPFNRGS
jgi:hypothetical protein